MNAEAQQILDHLATVSAERRRRAADAGLDRRVRAIKDYQHQRFATTYADLLKSPRYGPATQFFLEDLYGPSDFTRRDDQFARIVPALVRLFPHDIVLTVRSLAALHALSEQLDSCMAAVLPDERVDGTRYVQAWQSVGKREERERQIVLMLAVGSALDGFTRNPLLRHSLKLMRAPAKAAGLGELQTFLERGFDTFRSIRGAEQFLDTIARRERDLASALFSVDPVAAATGDSTTSGQLP